MKTITRRVGGELRSLTILTQEEADARGIDYVPWRQAKGGDVVLTDDGHVAECLARKTYTDSRGRTKTLVTLSFTRSWLPRRTPLEFMPFWRAQRFGEPSPVHWSAYEARRTRTRRTVDAFVQMLVHKTRIDWHRLGLIYRPDQKIPAATVRRLFKQPRIQTMIRDELKQVLVGEGITEQEVIRMYREAFDTARTTKNPAAMRSIAKDLADMLDMQPDDTRSPGGRYPFDEPEAEWEMVEGEDGLAGLLDAPLTDEERRLLEGMKAHQQGP